MILRIELELPAIFPLNAGVPAGMGWFQYLETADFQYAYDRGAVLQQPGVLGLDVLTVWKTHGRRERLLRVQVDCEAGRCS